MLKGEPLREKSQVRQVPEDILEKMEEHIFLTHLHPRAGLEPGRGIAAIAK